MPEITPYDWQLSAVAKTVAGLRASACICNTSETGTGKTIVALKAIQELDRKALIIAPKSIHTAWKRTAAAMEVSDHIVDVTNIERLKFKNPWYVGGKWTLEPGTQVVVDEAHKGLAGPKTITNKIIALTKAFRLPTMLMSATLADNPLKMRAIGYLLGLHQFNQGSFYNWCRANGCSSSPWHSGLEFTKGARGAACMQRIHTQIADRLVRLRIRDLPDFPENQILAELFDLDERDTEEINEIYAEMDEELRKQNSNPLTEMLRARQRTELLKVPLLQELILDAVEEDKSPVVFVNFRETLQRLHEELQSALGCTVGQIYGGQKDEERQAYIDSFQADLIPVMLAMSQAGGVGISLHATGTCRPRVSYLTPSFSATDMVQCLGRIHRAGGNSKSVQTLVLCAGTCEERIHAAVSVKLRNIGAFNDGLTDEDLK